ncbi:MAG: hypothetical protein UD299_07465 [Ruminococcus sp.]|nr:hypothetical protein [Ruminococcus sp.]
MWAARPHLGSIFEKTAAPKNFFVACGSFPETLLQKRIFLRP